MRWFNRLLLFEAIVWMGAIVVVWDRLAACRPSCPSISSAGTLELAVKVALLGPGLVFFEGLWALIARRDGHMNGFGYALALLLLQAVVLAMTIAGIRNAGRGD